MAEFDDSVIKRIASLEKNISALNESLSRLRPGIGNAAHANSGPTGHSNVPGHANFADLQDKIRDISVTLPDGTRVTLDANSPASITINGYKVVRNI